MDIHTIVCCIYYYCVYLRIQWPSQPQSDARACIFSVPLVIQVIATSMPVIYIKFYLKFIRAFIKICRFEK